MSISSSPISSRPISALPEAQGDLNGSLTVTLDNVTVSSVSDIDIAATASVTLDEVTVSSAATLSLSGTETTTLDDATVSSDATLLIQATASVTLDDATVSSDADLEIHADTSVTLDDVTVSAEGVGFITYTAELNVTLDDVSVFCDGNIRLPNTDADGDYGAWQRPGKPKFEKKRRIAELEREIAKALAPPPPKPTFTADEWISLFNSLAGPVPDYAAPLTQKILAQKQQQLEDDDMELLLLSI